MSSPDAVQYHTLDALFFTLLLVIQFSARRQSTSRRGVNICIHSNIISHSFLRSKPRNWFMKYSKWYYAFQTKYRKMLIRKKHCHLIKSISILNNFNLCKVKSTHIKRKKKTLFYVKKMLFQIQIMVWKILLDVFPGFNGIKIFYFRENSIKRFMFKGYFL